MVKTQNFIMKTFPTVIYKSIYILKITCDSFNKQ